jgi:hypothetical protein
VHGADHILALTVVTGHSSRSLDAAGDRRIGDEAVMPDLVHELLLGYQAISMPYEVGQNLQDLRLYVLQYSSTRQLEALQIHRYVCELLHRVRCPRNRTFHLHILSTPAPRLSAAVFLT